ncbi:MAG: hypothetical protein JSV80_09530 [Acidobacteriota bacterium]|nr:MAG: hypothetical protein JSV80_09530 [Acidobacteriota bacterium]
MLIKTFKASTATQALAEVRQALGPDTALLETRRVGGRIEVLAAAERPRPVTSRPPANEIGETSLPRNVGGIVEAGGNISDSADGAAELYEQLRASGFAQELTQRIVSLARERLVQRQLADPQLRLRYTRRVISGLLRRTTAVMAANTGLVALVGAPGVGKTTTAAKLAAHALVEQRGRRVVLASADTRRLGGAEQLDGYARAFDVPFYLVREPNDLARIRERAGEGGLVLLDTPGVPRADRRGLAALAMTLRGVSSSEIELLLSADSDSATMADVIRRFQPLEPGALCATRTDETVRPGHLVSAVARARLPLRHLGCGPDVPEDLEPVDPNKLAAWAVPGVAGGMR